MTSGHKRPVLVVNFICCMTFLGELQSQKMLWEYAEDVSNQIKTSLLFKMAETSGGPVKYLPVKSSISPKLFSDSRPVISSMASIDRAKGDCVKSKCFPSHWATNWYSLVFEMSVFLITHRLIHG